MWRVPCPTHGPSRRHGAEGLGPGGSCPKADYSMTLRLNPGVEKVIESNRESNSGGTMVAPGTEEVEGEVLHRYAGAAEHAEVGLCCAPAECDTCGS